MNNQEAIDVLLETNRTAKNQLPEFYEALYLAVKALEINEQYGGEIIQDNLQGWRYEPKKGEWEKYLDMRFPWAKCSNCNWDSSEPFVYAVMHFKYCPNCGADMRGEEDVYKAR